MFRRYPATPRHSPSQIGTQPRILKLAVIESLQCKITTPGQPPVGSNEGLQSTPDENRSGILLPRPPEEVLVDFRVLIVQCHVIVRTIQNTVLEHETGGLGRVGSSLGCQGVFFALFRVELPRANEDEAVLEYGGRVSENEVDVAMDFAGFVELAEGVGIESVLVTDEFAVFDDG